MVGAGPAPDTGGWTVQADGADPAAPDTDGAGPAAPDTGGWTAQADGGGSDHDWGAGPSEAGGCSHAGSSHDAFDGPSAGDADGTDHACPPTAPAEGPAEGLFEAVGRGALHSSHRALPSALRVAQSGQSHIPTS